MPGYADAAATESVSESNETGSFITMKTVAACADVDSGGGGAEDGCSARARGGHDDAIDILDHHDNGDAGGCFCAHLRVLSFRPRSSGTTPGDCVLS